VEPHVRIRVEIDKEGLIDDYLAYVTDPRPSRNEHYAVLLDSGPLPPAILEQMVLDGVTRREDVADLVTFVLERMHLESPVAQYRWTH
jgi:hypothetical protein